MPFFDFVEDSVFLWILQWDSLVPFIPHFFCGCFVRAEARKVMALKMFSFPSHLRLSSFFTV